MRGEAGFLFFVLLAGCSAVIGFEPVTYRATADVDAGTCPASAIACQDFSSAVTAPWALDDDGATSQVAVEGGALRVTIPNAGVGSGLVSFTGTTFTTGERVVIRMHVTLAASLANASLIELRHPDRNVSGGVSLKVIDGNLAYNVTSRAVATTANGVGDAGPPLGASTCVLFTVDVGAGGHVTIGMGATTIVDAPNVDTLAGETSWDALWIGLPFVDAPDGGATVHVDDIAIAQADLPCD